MKMKNLVITLLLGTLFSHADNVVWQTRIIQEQIGGATGIPELVEDTGSRSSLPIGENGSRFELWGWKFVDGQLVAEELLDSTEVGVYRPTAEIFISSRDKFEGFNRSRVDQPFEVTIKAENLVSAAIPNTPIAATRVLVEHWVDLYEDGSYDGSAIETTELISSFWIDAEDPMEELNFQVTNIKAQDIARRAGRERFIVYALADAEMPKRVIAENEIHMMPLTEGYLVGIDTSVSYKALPEFEAIVHRIYPGGSTWVEVYDGAFSEGERGLILGSTFESSGHDLTVHLTQLNFENFRDEVQPMHAGLKTMVLRTSAPFPGESTAEGGVVLDYQTITVGNTMRVNSMVIDMETAGNN